MKLCCIIEMVRTPKQIEGHNMMTLMTLFGEISLAAYQLIDSKLVSL